MKKPTTIVATTLFFGISACIFTPLYFMSKSDNDKLRSNCAQQELRISAQGATIDAQQTHIAQDSVRMVAYRENGTEMGRYAEKIVNLAKSFAK